MNLTHWPNWTRLTGLLVLLSPAACGQGTLSCSNVRLQNALITDCSGEPVGGPNYAMDIRVMNPQTKSFDGSVLQVTATTNQPLKRIIVLTGKNHGRFSAGTLLVPFVAPGAEATVELRAWDKSTGTGFDAAKIRGSSVFKIRLGGAGQPPSMPGTMTEFTGIKVCPVTPPSK